MKKRLSVFIAACAVLLVIFAGANGLACSSFAHARTVIMESAGCCPLRCPAKSGTQDDWTSRICGEYGYYGANVFAVLNGRTYAVCEGNIFEVTPDTPFAQVGNARYYFADENAKLLCLGLRSELGREAVELATVDGNVVGKHEGGKIAQCLVTGERFLVTADSPVVVADGRRYYLSDTTDLASLSGATHRN